MSIPDDYTPSRPACATCRHVFARQDFIDETTYFCTRLSQRPVPCGSSAIGEGFFSGSLNDPGVREEGGRRREAWEEWRDQHAVAPHGCCGSWAAR